MNERNNNRYDSMLFKTTSMQIAIESFRKAFFDFDKAREYTVKNIEKDKKMEKETEIYCKRIEMALLVIDMSFRKIVDCMSDYVHSREEYYQYVLECLEAAKRTEEERMRKGGDENVPESETL